MALLNRFCKLNDKSETGIFTFIVTKSVTSTRGAHRDATTKDFFFGYHRWALSFQRPNERTLGVHLLLRNPSANTACVVDFSLTILNRHHFGLNLVSTKKAAKFSIINPMQGVSRWVEVSELAERRFCNETGEFLFELTLGNVLTVFECDIQLPPSLLAAYRAGGGAVEQRPPPTNAAAAATVDNPQHQQQRHVHPHQQFIQLETNCFSFGAFEWSLIVVPLPAADDAPPVCRVYLNRLTGLDCLCRIKYRVILGHTPTAAVATGAASSSSSSSNAASSNTPSKSSSTDAAAATAASTHFVDSKFLDQISDTNGRIRGYQFRNAELLSLLTARGSSSLGGSGASPPHASAQALLAAGKLSSRATFELRVHIELAVANTVSEARALFCPDALVAGVASGGGALGASCASLQALASAATTPQQQAAQLHVANCSDRNKQSWSVECASYEAGSDTLRLKLSFLDLACVPRNHVRYISWIAYVVRRDAESGARRDSLPVQFAPHSNLYMQDGVDLGALMDTGISVESIKQNAKSYLDAEQRLTVHVEWVDSLLLFSHLHSTYDSLPTVQLHQLRREFDALSDELRALRKQLKPAHARPAAAITPSQQHQQPAAAAECPPSHAQSASVAQPLRKSAAHSLALPQPPSDSSSSGSSDGETTASTADSTSPPLQHSLAAQFPAARAAAAVAGRHSQLVAHTPPIVGAAAAAAVTTGAAGSNFAAPQPAPRMLPALTSDGCVAAFDAASQRAAVGVRRDSSAAGAYFRRASSDLQPATCTPLPLQQGAAALDTVSALERLQFSSSTPPSVAGGRMRLAATASLHAATPTRSLKARAAAASFAVSDGPAGGGGGGGGEQLAQYAQLVRRRLARFDDDSSDAAAEEAWRAVQVEQLQQVTMQQQQQQQYSAAAQFAASSACVQTAAAPTQAAPLHARQQYF